MRDFFISYNGADKAWAEWIAWVLEENAFSVLIQAWDFRPGGNFILDMQRATACDRTIAVLSENYLAAAYTQPEWAAAFKQDPTSEERKLIPVRVAECKPTGMLAPIVYVDLVGKTEAEAEGLVLDAIKERAKPDTRPLFPGVPPMPEPMYERKGRLFPKKVPFPGFPSLQEMLPPKPQPGQPLPSLPKVAPDNKARSAGVAQPLSPRERLALSRQLTGLTPQEFNDFLTMVNPPKGIVPPPTAATGDRSFALLSWAESTTGCGLAELQALLVEFLAP